MRERFKTYHHKNVQQVLHAEVWEILTGKKKVVKMIKKFMYDSVGFAMEDFSALRLT
ncbi:hypothetical protein ACP8HZ_04590 [Francisella noatunensis]